MFQRKLNSRRSQISRAGVAAVEFAIVAPIFFALLFMMVESSRYLMASHAVTGAAREAVRTAIILGTDDPETTNQAINYLQNSYFRTETVTVDCETEDADVDGMDVIYATVEIKGSDVSIIGDPFGFGGQNVSGYFAMLIEKE